MTGATSAMGHFRHFGYVRTISALPAIAIKQRTSRDVSEIPIAAIRAAERKLTCKDEALLVATTCPSPPADCACWTLTLLADVLAKLTLHESLSRRDEVLVGLSFSAGW